MIFLCPGAPTPGFFHARVRRVLAASASSAGHSDAASQWATDLDCSAAVVGAGLGGRFHGASAVES